MQASLDHHAEALAALEKDDFDVFALCSSVGRESYFPMAIFKLMNDLPTMNSAVTINNDKLIRFLQEIYKGYRRDVAYHNDLHGADVAQMMYMFIKQGDLATIA